MTSFFNSGVDRATDTPHHPTKHGCLRHPLRSTPDGVSLAAERNRSLTERGSRATSGARHLDDQVDQALCLTLVTNAAVLWTATYLGDALDAPRRT